jgi:GH25 family lysozyme M1 (1,4-beta-N-acetylmuramidase)
MPAERRYFYIKIQEVNIMQQRNPANLPGVDISHYETGIIISDIAAQGKKVVYFKASEGSTVIDASFPQFNPVIRTLGLHTGAYHFAHFYKVSTIPDQVTNFLNQIKGQTLDCAIAIDCELASWHDNVDAATVTAQALDWAQRVKAATGAKVIVYANSDFIKEYFTADIKELDAWIADTRNPTAPGENGIYETWLGFQYSFTGSVGGKVVDLDEFTSAALMPAFTYGVPVPAPQPAQAPADNGSRPAPAFPLAAGQYFGPEGGGVDSISGYHSHRDDLRRYQQRMKDRGWNITVDGLYGKVGDKIPQGNTADITGQFQSEKGLKVDKLIGPQTWAAAWTAPITQ